MQKKLRTYPIRARYLTEKVEKGLRSQLANYKLATSSFKDKDSTVTAGGLRATELRISPPVVQRGSDATLTCLYEMTDAPLYSVKWYRGRHEFYRYSPTEAPATKIFLRRHQRGRECDEYLIID
ncbi:hypothetical protein EVAR_45727_1 [Eumeta japonica]|uniref:Ig-like domain-containing protein n=1 Tax=Eumeta variegata TaxID=151549 RepID=A0A4C1WZC1_EUMVA|nr:hypothetical protein EVAR_45727_1 [Eumeta japonica]